MIVSGRVVNIEDGHGISKVSVSIFNDDACFEYSGISDSQGNFQIVGVPSGNYTIHTSSIYNSCPDNLLVDDSTNKSFSVTSGNSVSGLIIKMRMGESVSGKILGPDVVSPISGAVLSIVPRKSGKQQVFLSQLDGSYSIAGIDAKKERSSHCLVVRFSGYANVQKVFKLSRGEHIIAKNIVIGNGIASIAGNVLSDTGAPLPGVHITAFSLDR